MKNIKKVGISASRFAFLFLVTIREIFIYLMRKHQKIYIYVIPSTFDDSKFDRISRPPKVNSVYACVLYCHDTPLSKWDEIQY